MNNSFKILLLSIIFPIFLLCENIQTTPIKLINKDVTTVAEQTTQTPTKTIEEQIDEQNKMLQDVIKNINNESYLTTLQKQEEDDNEVFFLTNRINANNIQRNSLAVKRDELKIATINQRVIYEKTLRDLIQAKEEFRDVAYYQQIILKSINAIKNFNLDDYSSIYDAKNG